ncbi:MAG: RidA family protein [Verrucomicrobiales bacterium]|jgi:2-iminobutanoate/2-iminopropanoate deaminase|nr:RidA family protein [Verrucomicrobiales bacterium]
MTLINSPQAPAAVGPYSHAARVGNLLFCSGQIPLDPETMKIVDGGIEAQTQQVIANIKALLGTVGAGLPNVAKTTIFLTDLGDFATVNGIYEEAFGDHKPARSTIQVAALPLGSNVEIECIVELNA